MPKPPAEVTTFLDAYDPAVRDLALKLRDLVLKVAPDAQERVHRPWKTISYGVGQKFCAISPHKTWVNLQFHGGALLDDAKSLLEGTGKSMRHARFAKLADVKRAGVRGLIADAAAAARK